MTINLGNARLADKPFTLSELSVHLCKSHSKYPIKIALHWVAKLLYSLCFCSRIKSLKGAYSVRNFEKCIFSIILYIKVKHLENVVSKFQDDWRKI